PQDCLDQLALRMHEACRRGLPHIHRTLNPQELLLRAAAAVGGLAPRVPWPPAIRSRIESRQTKRALARFFRARGCIYGPIRQPELLRCLPDLQRRKVLLLLRDPRDILTSLYFSVSISHVEPGNPYFQAQFRERRQQSLSQSIDSFVRERTPKLLSDFRKYCDFLHAHPNACLLRYEDMVRDFSGFLDNVSNYWGLSVDAPTRERLLALADFAVSTEDVHSHKRQVTPGDHRRKLSADSVRWLTDQFLDALETLGYGPEGEIRPLKCVTSLNQHLPRPWTRMRDVPSNSRQRAA
ncbi:MAG TPA: sulfotransferase domain-containing protein, partial [Pirellulaceae bacterium]|nr:sulfotransferase domain-containing protein [Pirellulaceae bacterium]